MDVTVGQIVVILVAGLVAGFVNTMAGGGSFLTVSALNMAGLDILVANATNRVAIVAQTFISVLGFRSKGVGDARLSLEMAVPATLGAIVGANLALDMPKIVLHRALGVAMLIMLVILIVNPKKFLQGRQIEMTTRRRIVGYAVFFLVGIYGGAIQAGVGFLLIASLVLFAGQDLVKTNALKVFIICCYTLVALIMFALKGQVNWVLGLMLAVGNGTGGWVASRLAVEKGEILVRYVLMAMLVVLAVRYLDIIPGF